MAEKNPWADNKYDYCTLRECVRNRPGLYFVSADLIGLHNAIMDLIHYCIDNQKKDIGVVIDGSDITIRHEGERLASGFDTDIVRSACETFEYGNNQYRFIFDKEVFTHIEPNRDALFDALRELAFLDKSLKIRFNGHLFHYENGLMDLYRYLKIKEGFYWHDKHHPLGFSEKEGDMEVDAVFAAVDSMDPCIFSYVNNRKTEEHGAHVDGFIRGLREAAYKYRETASEYDKPIRKEDIALIIHIKTQNPQYTGSTKRKLTNKGVYRFVKDTTKQYFSRVFADNPDLALPYVKW